MATPDIGTTIHDGYSNGMARLGPNLQAALVPALICGVLAGVVAVAQQHAFDVSTVSFFETSSDDSTASLLGYQLLNAVVSAVEMVFGVVTVAIFGGAMHRARHGGAESIPAPGQMWGAIMATISKLMPKLAVLVGLSIAVSMLIVLGAFGAVLALAAIIALVWLGVKWTYASVIVGAEEAENDAAYERSESVVDGSWWATFGVFVVVGLATLVPVAIVGAIAAKIVPTVFLTALAPAVISILAYATLGAAVFDSAWSQVEDSHSDGHRSGIDATPGNPTAFAPVTPPIIPSVAPVEPGAPPAGGPFI
ncbi:MAG: hypothetical protein JWN41_611 [Thermoleophilia bacterium]|nr:hypothetical protein [Thermoleophilia bacterium]